MGLVLWCSFPILLYLFRKYRERGWGWYTDKPVLKDQIFIITGSNCGIGKEAAKELAIRNAKVIMACRDLQKCEAAVKDIRRQVKTGELIPMELDLASIASIQQFADEVLGRYPKINVLINNAGVSIPYPQTTEDGFEVNMGVNHLGHFLLTNLLIDRLQQTANSRVVVVSSKLHESGVIDFDSITGNKLITNRKVINPAYNNSKLANVYFAREMAERYPEVQTYALCPGFCYTDLFRYSNIKWFQYFLFLPVAYFFMRSARQGAQTILYCSLSNNIKGLSGQMFRDCKPYKSPYNFNPEDQKRLWLVSEQLTGINKVLA